MHLRRATFLVLLCIVALHVSAQRSHALQSQPAPSDGLRFAVSEATVWLERSCMLACEVPQAGVERSFEVELSDPSVVRVLRTPHILEGATSGWMRLRGLRVGETVVRCGTAQVLVRVAPLTAVAGIDAPRLRIVTPASGATVLGAFSVGVELWDPGRELAQSLRLVSSDGQVHEPTSVELSAGPEARARFDLVSGSLAPGVAGLVARLEAQGELHESEAVSLFVSPDRESEPVSGVHLIAGECEEHLADERPANFGVDAPRRGWSPEASGEHYVVCERPDPVLVMRVELPHAGLWQLRVRARGDRAGGAWPTVGWCRDDPYAPLTSGRLAGSGWHWISVGRPQSCPAGEQIVALRFTNDRRIEGGEDRALWLDRYELVSVAEGGADQSAASSSMTMMTGERMSPASMGGRGGARNASNAMQAAAAGDLSIAFERPFHGLPVNGPHDRGGALSLDARRWCARPDRRVVAQQRTVSQSDRGAPDVRDRSLGARAG